MRFLGLGRTRSLAHAGRLHRLGQALVMGGHTVSLAGACRWEAALGRELPWVEHPEPEEAGGPDEIGRFALALHQDLALLRALAPDRVFVDHRRSALVAAAILGIPSLSITGAASLGPGCLLTPTVSEWASLVAPTLGLDPVVAMGIAGLRGLDSPMPLGSAPLPEALAAVIEAAGGVAPQLVADLSLGDETVVADAPALFPLHPEAPVVSGGALLPAVRGAVPEGFVQAPGPRVILSMGSTGDRSILPLLLDALSSCAVALSGAAPAGREHPRLWAAPLLDLGALLPQADLLVCHGGAMTVQAALAAGVPTLAIPDNVDAALCAVALIQSGAGTAFSPGDLRADPDLAGRALRWLLDDPRFHQRAQSLAPAMDPAGALRLAVAQALGQG